MTVRWLEILAAAREDLHNAMLDPAQHDALPGRIQRLLRRARGSSYSDLDGTDRFYLWRMWFEALEDFNEYDPADPTVRWIDKTFSDEQHWLRMFSVWWWDTGMMVGSRYATGADGVAGDVDLSQPPMWPFSYTKAKNFIPDLIIYDVDESGNPIEPPNVYNIVWDMSPGMITVGQHSQGKGREFVMRRAMQATSNLKLDASAFGVPPWSPETRAQIRRKQRILLA